MSSSKTNKSYRTFKRNREIGEHTVTLPEPPPIETIANYGLKEKDQKFVPTPLPEDWEYLDDADKLDFQKQELDRCKNGYWFFNNGNLEYLTGHHYFYINWFKIKVEDEISGVMSFKLPYFTDTDRDFYYLWDFVENNRNVGGIVYITKRRSGKTYRAAEIIFRRATRFKNLHAGIQSKNEVDAAEVVQMIIEAMDEIPQFLKPKDDGQISSKKGIYFYPPTLKDTKTKHSDKKKDKTYWYSKITSKATTHNAYDSGNLGFYLMDEAGKWERVDVNAALSVVQKTMTSGASLTGKCIVTSTVEEMEKKGGKELLKIWEKADSTKLNAYGRTANTLIRYFEPAYRGYRGMVNGEVFIDEYGYSKDKEAKAFLTEIRNNLTGSDLQDEMRMNPFVVEDAFQIINTDCPFDAKNLKDTIKYNQYHVNEDNLIRGNFEWTTSIHVPEVEFVHDKEGKFYISKLQEPEKRNKYTTRHTRWGVQREPTIKDHSQGIDPVDHLKSNGKDNSEAAIHLFRKYNPLYPTNSECFTVEYIYRPDTPEEFWEDALKVAVFYSCDILTEYNKPGLNTFFRLNGYYGYLMDRPESVQNKNSRKNEVEKGIYMTDKKSRDYLIGKVKSYVKNDLGLDEEGMIKKFMPFDRTLKTYLNFTPENWTPHDAFVSSSLALLGAEEKAKRVVNTTTINQMIPRFNNTGRISKMI